ncbi:MAG: thiamine-monophosphate kinase [Planctomycetales bacterium]|nr:thiamine-monophosphate kinase [Planctomycetales bacterium]NIM08675.1 thiamine-monophosphate kinase [Planctomycetales bacterium]NIN08149.1 thiamine-monophosphate kinase [Planctomycetales bacterium]NIN77276.1 thiamine-monophosphate kinase [Planctomycetales bacterium]NIO34460.1 thiamine-monophosphate kinase [Planctomycetales bacterium]
MESEFVRWLRARLPSRPPLGVGPGDDAAVLRLGEAGAQAVVTCDLIAEGVHFRLDRDAPRRIGRKALAVNLSDLAAMAAVPVAAFLAVLLPRDEARQLAPQLWQGLQPLADQYDLAIAGGDTNTWDGPLVISATLIGETIPPGPLLRSGARPGDQLLVTGRFGGSQLGHHLDFEPRVREALLLVERYTVHAGMDCSDGLALDVSRLAEESGCGAVIDPEAIPLAEAAGQLAKTSGRTAIEHALGDGEDFELLLAAPPDEAKRMLAEQPLPVTLTRVGEFIDQPGLWQNQGERRVKLEPLGYEH